MGSWGQGQMGPIEKEVVDMGETERWYERLGGAGIGMKIRDRDGCQTLYMKCPIPLGKTIESKHCC